MSKTVVIDPVTRIEGHAKISVYLDDAGEVENARFHVVEFRGFEKFAKVARCLKWQELPPEFVEFVR